jgi:hypothetical protein
VLEAKKILLKMVQEKRHDKCHISPVNIGVNVDFPENYDSIGKIRELNYQRNINKNLSI